LAETGYKSHFGNKLAILLAEKLSAAYPEFKSDLFSKEIKRTIGKLELKDRVALIAESLRKFLPQEYPSAVSILYKILGPENEKETGMFTTGYWLMPVAKFVEAYGLDHYKTSMDAIYEITKRHTGEYAIRPFVKKYPEKTLDIVNRWAQDKNVHVRRLASEGIRPRLPWAQKLSIFIDDPSPVFEILEHLKDDPSKFVQKSVGNNINDYLKENPAQARKLIARWSKNPTPQRQWILAHALRNERR
jgi:3-methyladenine DNA glycosylase AlkC